MPIVDSEADGTKVLYMMCTCSSVGHGLQMEFVTFKEHLPLLSLSAVKRERPGLLGRIVAAIRHIFSKNECMYSDYEHCFSVQSAKEMRDMLDEFISTNDGVVCNRLHPEPLDQQKAIESVSLNAYEQLLQTLKDIGADEDVIKSAEHVVQQKRNSVNEKIS